MEKKINPLDFDNNAFIGLKLPLFYSDNQSFNMNMVTVDHVKTKLKNLIFTQEGERVMNPTFGCDFNKVLFEQETGDNMVFYIESHIKDKIKTWIPEVEVQEVKINVDLYTQHAINVLIIYKIIYEPDTKENLSFTINMN